MKVSNSVKEKIKPILKKENSEFFRVAIEGGGCSGFKYIFELGDMEDEDLIFNEVVIVDPLSFEYLRNSELIFEDSLFNKTFKVINPDVKTTCGCGESIGF